MKNLSQFVAEELSQQEVKKYNSNRLHEKKQMLVAIKKTIEQYERDNRDNEDALSSLIETLFGEISNFANIRDLQKAIDNKDSQVQQLQNFYLMCDKTNRNIQVDRTMIKDVICTLSTQMSTGNNNPNLNAAITLVAKKLV